LIHLIDLDSMSKTLYIGVINDSNPNGPKD